MIRIWTGDSKHSKATKRRSGMIALPLSAPSKQWSCCVTVMLGRGKEGAQCHVYHRWLMLDIANIGEKKDILGLLMELSNPLNVLFWFWVGLGVFV